MIFLWLLFLKGLEPFKVNTDVENQSVLVLKGSNPFKKVES